MATYASAAEYAAAQERLLSNLRLYRDPLELAVRTTLALQVQRIFDRGENAAGGPIGQYDTTRGFYVNPKTAVRSTGGRARGGFNLQGLLPTRGNPNASLIEDPAGEHIFTPLTAHRGVKGTKAGDPHRTTYVANMKDFRNRIGRRVDRVNLELTGDLRLDLSSGQLPAQVRGESLEVDVKLKRRANVAKKASAEEKYGRVFNLTLNEVDEFVRVLRYELREAFRKYGGRA